MSLLCFADDTIGLEETTLHTHACWNVNIALLIVIMPPAFVLLTVNRSQSQRFKSTLFFHH